MKSIILSIVLLLASLPVFAQKTVTLTPSITAGDGQITIDISWSTNPPITTGTPCVASSTPAAVGWSGAKAGSGTVTNVVIPQNTRLTLDCNFLGDSIATFTWTNPPQNTDNTPYTNPKNVLIKYTFNGTLTAGATVAAGETVVTVAQTPAPATIRTVTGITQVGTLRAVAYAQNQNDAIGAASTAATKVYQGNVIVQQGVDITVRSVPGAVSGFGIQ